MEKVEGEDGLTNIIRVRKFMDNVRRHRRQLVVDVIHPTKRQPSKAYLREKIASMYDVETNTVFVFSMRTSIGGNRSTGFALIYENFEYAKIYEPRHRLIKVNFLLHYY